MVLCLKSISCCSHCSVLSFELEHAYDCSVCWLSWWYGWNLEVLIHTEVRHLVTCSIMIQAASQGYAVVLYMWLFVQLFLLGLCSIKWDMARFERNYYFEVQLEETMKVLCYCSQSSQDLNQVPFECKSETLPLHQYVCFMDLWLTLFQEYIYPNNQELTVFCKYYWEFLDIKLTPISC
jgi:hypothetical protein